MSAGNVFRLWKDALTKWGEKLDLKSGDILAILPVVDDTGEINIGNGTLSIDVQWFGSSASNYVLLDVGNDAVVLDGIDIELGDTDLIVLGDGRDIVIQWNGSFLEVTSAANPMWANCPSKLDPNYSSVAYEFFDDFMDFDDTATVGRWTPFNVGTGTDAISTVTAGGSVILTCQSTTDNACEQISAIGSMFKLAAGKTLWFEARVKFTGDVAQSEISLGLSNSGEDLKAVADVLPQDGISFSKQDGAAAMAFTASKDGTDTGALAAVHTIVSGNWVVFGFLVDGLTSITPYVNGVAKTAITATLCDDEVLTPFFLVRNGDATTTEILEIDYVRIVQLR